MIDLLFNQLFGDLFSSLGSSMLGCVIIMVLLLVGMLFCGMDIDLAMVLISPIPYAFYKAGYLPIWVSALFILIPLSYGIYSVYMRFVNRY